MNILEAFDELTKLNEESTGGQKTYKDFLVELANFLDIPTWPSYDSENWVLHHIDCNHFNNKPSNIVLMDPAHHKSLHIQLRNGVGMPASEFLGIGTTKNGTNKKFDYWPIGKDILERINTVRTEDDIPTIISDKNN